MLSSNGIIHGFVTFFKKMLHKSADFRSAGRADHTFFIESRIQKLSRISYHSNLVLHGQYRCFVGVIIVILFDVLIV